MRLLPGQNISAQVFIIHQLAEDFTHGFAFELKAVGVVHQTVQDTIGQCALTDTDIPLIVGQLTNHER